MVRKAAIVKIDQLKVSNRRVGVQQTKAVLQKRSEMYPNMNRERAAGKSVKWSGAKVMVQQQPGGRIEEVKS